MANTSIYNAFERMWQHVVAALGDKVSKVEGKGLSTNDFTNEYKGKVDSALQSFTETDPTVPAWAKAANKPTYTAAEVGAATSGHTHKLDDFKEGYLRSHPESRNNNIIPFIYNDLAFLLQKGGACNCYVTTASDDFTQVALSNAASVWVDSQIFFNGAPDYVYFGSLITESKPVFVIDITLHKHFSYGNKFYIDFGAWNWGTPEIQVYAMNSNTEASYVQELRVSASDRLDVWHAYLSHSSTDSNGNSVNGFNKIRIVFPNFYPDKRIGQIGLINFNSYGVKETFVSRGGCDGIYGPLVPYTDGAYDLGSSAKKWNNIYANAFKGTADVALESETTKKLYSNKSSSSNSASDLYWHVYEWTISKSWEACSAIYGIVDNESSFNGVLSVKVRTGSPSTSVSTKDINWFAANKTPPSATITYTQNEDSVTFRLYIKLAAWNSLTITKIHEVGQEGVFVNTQVTVLEGTVGNTSDKVKVDYASSSDSANSATKASQDADGNVIKDTYVKKSEALTCEHYDATISTTWTGDSAPYSQTITVEGIIADDRPKVDVVMSGVYATDQTRLDEFDKIYRIVTAGDSITVYAHEKTTAAIPIQLEVTK